MLLCLGINTQESIPTPNTAVKISIINVDCNVLSDNNKPAAAGAANWTSDCIVALIPLKRIS